MKKFILFILIMLYPLTATAGYVAIKKVVAGCTTANDSALFDYTGNDLPEYAYITGTDGSNDPVAIQFVTSGTMTLTEYNIQITDGIVTAGDIIASIYTDSGGSLGTQVTGTSKVLNISTLGLKTFTLDTPKTGLNGTYWLVINGLSNPGTVEMYTRYISYGQTHRIYVNGEYADNGQVRMGVHGCTE